MANDKTEKATPKKRDDARKKGQVAKSADINGAAILLAGLIALSVAGPKAMEQMKLAMAQALQLMAHPDVVDRKGVGTLFLMVGQHIGLAILPIVGTCFVAGLVASAAQVGLKPTPNAIKPDFKKLNPAAGLKNLFNPQHLAFETGKNLFKTAIVGAVAAMAVLPKLDEMAAMVATPPQQLIPLVASMVMTIATRAAIAYLLIAAVDYAYQKHKHNKNLKMDKEEV